MDLTMDDENDADESEVDGVGESRVKKYSKKNKLREHKTKASVSPSNPLSKPSSSRNKLFSSVSPISSHTHPRTSSTMAETSSSVALQKLPQGIATSSTSKDLLFSQSTSVVTLSQKAKGKQRAIQPSKIDVEDMDSISSRLPFSNLKAKKRAVSPSSAWVVEEPQSRNKRPRVHEGKNLSR